MARAKTRFEASEAYANGVQKYGNLEGNGMIGFYVQRAFIDGAKWQKNRSNRRAVREHNARLRAAEGKEPKHG